MSATSVQITDEEVTALESNTEALTTTESTEVPASTPAEKPAETPAAETPAAETPASSTEVDLDSAANELISKGEISAETLTALEAKGFNKAQVSRYAKGIQAEAAEAVTKLAERVGGKEQLDAMLAWAKQGGMTAAEQASYSKLVTSGDESQMGLALDGLAARFDRANGTQPDRVSTARGVVNTGVKGFDSDAQVVSAMEDPRYERDPAYRQSVLDRLKESDVLAIRAL